MLQITSEAEFTASLKAFVPVDEYYREDEFTARFRLLNTSQLQAYDLNTTEGTTAFLQDAIIGLTGLVDDQGNPVAYDKAVRDQVIDMPHARMALIRGYFRGVDGARNIARMN